MGFSNFKDALNIIRSGKSLLDTPVTNISPNKENFTSESLKDIWLMLNDVNYLLRFKTILDDPGRKILSHYNKFKNIYKKEYKNIINWTKKAGKMEEKRIEYKESFYGFVEMIKDMKSKINSIKENMRGAVKSNCELKENTEKIEELNRKLASKNLEIARIEEEWDTESKKFKEKRKKELNEEYYRKLEEVDRALSEYATKNFRKKNYKTANDMLNALKNGKCSKTIKFLSGIKENLNFWGKYGRGDLAVLFVKWVGDCYPKEYDLLYGKNKKIFEAKLDFDADGIDKLKGLKEKYERCAKEIENIEKERKTYTRNGEVLERSCQKLRKSEEEEKKMTDSIEMWNETIFLYQKAYQNYHNCLVEYKKIADGIVGCCGVILTALDELESNVIKSDADKKSYKKASEYKGVSGSKIPLIQVLGVSKFFTNKIKDGYEGVYDTEYNEMKDKFIEVNGECCEGIKLYKPKCIKKFRQ